MDGRGSNRRGAEDAEITQRRFLIDVPLHFRGTIVAISIEIGQSTGGYPGEAMKGESSRWLAGQ